MMATMAMGISGTHTSNTTAAGTSMNRNSTNRVRGASTA